VVTEVAEKSRVGYRSLFRNRDYRLLFTGLTISMSGSWAYNVALVVFVFNATHSPAWVAAASMTRFLTALVSSPLGGLVADRIERVRLMVSLDLLALTFQTAMAVVAALNGPIVLAIAFAALTSVSTASYDPAARAATPTIVGEEHLAAANSVQSAVENLSIIVGPAVGGLILLLGPPAIVFAVNAATFGFSAFVVSRMRARNRPADITEGGTTGPLQQMAAGIKAFAESSTVRLLAGFSILASFVYGTDTVLFVVVSLACTAATVVFVAGTRPLILLLALLLAPFVFLGSLCVQGYVFISWLEGRALARAYPHSPRHIPGALAAWLARKLKADLGAPPPVPWIPALILLVAPFALLVFVSPRMALSLVALTSALPVLYARFDR